MSDKNISPIKQAIQKRKTQEIMRSIEDKKIAQAKGTGPLSAPPKRTGPLPPAPTSPPDAKRSTQSIEQASLATVDVKRSTQTVSHSRPLATDWRTTQTNAQARTGSLKLSRKAGLIAAIASLVIVVITGAVLLFAGNAQPMSTKWAPLPAISAENMMAHLLAVGVSVSNVQRVNLTRLTSWKAIQGFDFKVDQNPDHGQFILLSYASDEGANQAAFRASLTKDYKQWLTTKVSNVLLLASPDSSKTIFSEMASHLRQFVVAPYRSFLPTATYELP